MQIIYIRNYTTMCKLFLLDMNIWYHITACKQMVINFISKKKLNFKKYNETLEIDCYQIF